MRYMIIVKATQDSEAGAVPDDALMVAMAKFHEELVNAGVLLSASGLRSSSKGWRIKYSGDQRTLIEGPFNSTNELIAGYTIIQVKSKEEAINWSMRFPNPAGESSEAEIEVRRFFELENFRAFDATQNFYELETQGFT